MANMSTLEGRKKENCAQGASRQVHMSARNNAHCPPPPNLLGLFACECDILSECELLEFLNKVNNQTMWQELF